VNQLLWLTLETLIGCAGIQVLRYRHRDRQFLEEFHGLEDPRLLANMSAAVVGGVFAFAQPTLLTSASPPPLRQLSGLDGDRADG
jgi:hypothetical protein